MRKRTGVSVFSQFSVVNACSVETDRGADIWLQCGAEGEVATDTESHCAEFTGGNFGVSREPVQPRSTTAIKIGDGGFHGIFEAACTASVVEKDRGAGRFDAVVDFRRCGYESITREAHAGAEHGAGELEDVGVTPDRREAAFGMGRGDEGSHGSGIGRDIYIRGFDDHGPYSFTGGRGFGKGQGKYPEAEKMAVSPLSQRPHAGRGHLRQASITVMMRIATFSKMQPMKMNEETHRGPASPITPLERRKRILLALALLIGTMTLYAPALRNGFVSLDDPDYVTRNARVQQGFNLSNVKWAFGTVNPVSNWHPLTWISHMLDVSWYGGNAAGHHFTNVLLHGMDVAFLFLLLGLATGETMRSAAVAALFAVHPLNVEAVAWVAERKSVLCVLFFLLTMIAYVWYARRPGVGRYLTVVACFALALLSKVMVVTLPCVLLLLDYWPLGRIGSEDGKSSSEGEKKLLLKLVWEKVPLLLMAFAASGMTLYIHRREHALATSLPLSWLVKNGIYSYLVYLGKAVLPVRLAAFYPHPENSLSWLLVVLCLLVLIGITALVWKSRVRKYLIFGWLWYLGTMFPMVGFIQSGRQGMADRYMYIPMIGLFVGAVWFLADLAAEKRWNPSVVSLLLVLVIAPCAYLTEVQIGYWHDSYTLFAHTLAVTSRNGMAENSFGSELMEHGQWEAAAEHFEAAVRYSPDLPEAHYNLGITRQRANRAAEAEQEYRTALNMMTDPVELAQAHNNLGMVYAGTQKYQAALAEFNAAIKMNANERNSYMGRGRIELQQFDYENAADDFARAAQITPSPQAYFWLGRALEAKGDAKSAAGAYTGALRLAPGFEEAKARLDALRSGQGAPK